jgi:predicted glycosyltransferase
LRAAAAAQPGLEAVRAVDDLAAELASARASISQCGYNTALELLWARVPALVVPYGAPGEDEQRRRAARLLRAGAVRTLHPRRLSGHTLARELPALLEFEPRPLELGSDGAEATAEALAGLVARRAAAAA